MKAIGIMEQVIRTRSQAEWLERLAGVDCCVTPILTVAEALAHPLFTAREMVETISGDAGASTVPAFPIRFVGEDRIHSRPAKRRGADQAMLD